jgi:hypothetical protein
MKAHVEIGEACQLHLQHAVLVYGSPHRAFATLYEITQPKDVAPLLGPARPISLAFLRRLAGGLGSKVAAEILPVNVLGGIRFWFRQCAPVFRVRIRKLSCSAER